MSDLMVMDELLSAARECGVAEHALMADPGFDEGGRIHNWRNYIPSFLAKRWADLEPETRLALAIVAEEQARAEIWE